MILDWRYYKTDERLIVIFNGLKILFSGIEEHEIKECLQQFR